MGLGLLILMNVGNENIYLSTQPEITFFKIAYKRYTNFSIEQTSQYFKTTPDFGRRCTVNIGKNADLMGLIHLFIELPNIQMENISSKDKKFKWVNKIGLIMINFIEIEIGGSIIDRHYSDWLNIWHELIINNGVRDSYDKMIGNISELYEYSTVKNTYKLYIPLIFWFCNSTDLALPLISLSHSDIKIHVEFNDIDLCYNLSPSYYIKVTNNFCILKKGEIIYQYYKNTKILGEYIYFDNINNLVYYNPIKDKFIIPITLSDTSLKIYGSDTNFILYIYPNSVVVKDIDYFKFNKPSIVNSYLLINYIYLDNYERQQFIKTKHDYIIQVVQTIPEETINSVNHIYKIPLYNPIKLLVWKCILISNKILNKHFEYTSYPFIDIDINLINKNLLVINSINRIELNSNEYYTNIQNYQYNFSNKQKGIYMYSFSLYPKDIVPSGSMNFSKIDDAYLKLSMNSIVNYQNPILIQAYGIQYNLLRISNGIAGLVFNI